MPPTSCAALATHRPGERHWPLGAAPADLGDLRTPTAVIDTSAQRAESAFRATSTWISSHTP